MAVKLSAEKFEKYYFILFIASGNAWKNKKKTDGNLKLKEDFNSGYRFEFLTLQNIEKHM